MKDLLAEFGLPEVAIVDGDDDLTNITRHLYTSTINGSQLTTTFTPHVLSTTGASIESEVAGDSALPVVA